MGTVRYTTVGGEVVAEKRGGVRRQYVPDPLGSTVALLDSGQSKTDTFAYWPYGEEAARTGTTPTPFRYVGTLGYYRDGAARSYVRARHLDTRAGRWTSEDPIGVRFSGNPFVYVAARPLRAIDPSGHQSSECCDSTGKPLSCKQVCAIAKGKPGFDKSGGAGVVCCGGSIKCVCIFKLPDYPGEGKCEDLDACIHKHERQHFDDVACDPKQGVHRPGWKRPEDRDKRECKLYRESLRCMERALENSSDCRTTILTLIKSYEVLIAKCRRMGL